MEIQRYNIFINCKSNQRSNGTNEEFNFDLKAPIALTNVNNYFKLKVEMISIPFSFKTINESNNTIQCNTNGGMNVSLTVNIPYGNYDVNTLISLVQTSIRVHANITIIYDKATSTISFTTTSNLAIRIFPCFIMQMLGIYELISIVVNDPYTSEHHVNMCPIQAIMLRSENLRQLQYNVESITMPYDQSDILCRVPITNINAYIHYQDNPLEIRILDKIISTINLYLTDDNSYDTLNLYSLPWTVVISIREIHNEDDHEKLISNVKNDVVQPQQQHEEHNKVELFAKLNMYQNMLTNLTKNTDKITDEITDEITDDQN